MLSSDFKKWFCREKVCQYASIRRGLDCGVRSSKVVIATCGFKESPSGHVGLQPGELHLAVAARWQCAGGVFFFSPHLQTHPHLASLLSVRETWCFHCVPLSVTASKFLFVTKVHVVRSPSSALLPFLGGGFLYSNRLQKKGYPYSNLSTGRPR